jgi:tripartite-type tricarboxylate transporter receptor subunit TctC
MKLRRRRFLLLAASAAALPALPRMAFSQTYPTRPVRIVVGFAAGGPNDIMARLIGQSLTERLGQPFIVENRPGAGSNIAVASVVTAAPDGYTLLQVATTNAINATLYDNLSFNFIRDVAPVAGISRAPLAMVVSPTFAAKTVPEFIAYAKAHPGKINFASAGVGSAPHVSGELFNSMAGVKMVNVAYRGGGVALIDLLGGQVQVMFESILAAGSHIKAGKLRALAVTSATRSALLPDVPSVGEFVPGYESSAFFGICAPKNTPLEIIEQLNKAINASLADPTVQQKIANLGGTPMPLTSTEFGKFLADQTEKWGKVIRSANIKPI